MRHNTSSEIYLPACSLKSCKHVTQRFKNWWATKHGAYFEDNRHHLVSSVIPLPLQPRLPKNRGSNKGGKKIRLVEAMAPTLEKDVAEHKDESDNNKSDRHWKRPLKKAKVSGDDSCGRGSSAMRIPDVPPLVYIFSFFNNFLLLFIFFVSDLSIAYFCNLWTIILKGL